MASKEYWGKLFKAFDDMSEEEFAKLVEEVEKDSPVQFCIEPPPKAFSPDGNT